MGEWGWAKFKKGDWTGNVGAPTMGMSDALRRKALLYWRDSESNVYRYFGQKMEGLEA